MTLPICKKHEESLILVASGVADAGTTEFLRAHLEECETCRAELDRLKRILSAMEQEHSASARMTPPQTLHPGLMKRLRAEAHEQPEGPTSISWADALKSWLQSRRRAWAIFALGAMGAVILVTLRWVGESGKKINSADLAKWHDNKPGELARFAGQLAGPVELRRSLLHSFEDFEIVLRRNDRLLATRDPVAIPSNARSLEGP
jgi:hypothetical protein